MGPYCLSCEDTQTAPLTGYWELADTCEMCWRDNLTLPPGIPGGPVVVEGAVSGGNLSSGATAGIASLGPPVRATARRDAKKLVPRSGREGAQDLDPQGHSFFFSFY